MYFIFLFINGINEFTYLEFKSKKVSYNSLPS